MLSENETPSKLYIVGIGPGSPHLMTLRARQALEEAKYVVGYRTYLDLVSGLLQGKEVITGTMGREVDRVTQALELLEEGPVAIISSGDPNVYGMGALGLEMADKKGLLHRVEIVPGVTSFAAAACQAGVGLRKCLAVVSLSDLLTPWSDIEARVRLVVSMDIPLAIYNPKSRKRRWQLEKVLEIYLEVGRGNSEILVARNVCREGQELTYSTVDGMTEDLELMDSVDMFTLLMIGGHGWIRGFPSSTQSTIHLVGAGPGSRDQLTWEAMKILQTSHRIFGAGRYAGSLGFPVQSEPIGEPYTSRMSQRWNEAREVNERGQQVSLLMGGDPSLFGSGWRIFSQEQVHICPGISAFSAAASSIGAPFSNDFLLLAGPGPEWERFIAAGYSIVWYNMKTAAIGELLASVPGNRPCAICQDVYRPSEVVVVSKAMEMEVPAGLERATVIVASESSRIKDGRIISRRGYDAKYCY